ncbi:hypothetical protein [Acinetobacter phage Ab69]|nr:hypothetical protein [Acinetobacter phage Ab69]
MTTQSSRRVFNRSFTNINKLYLRTATRLF